MTDSDLLGNADKEIDIDLPAEETPKAADETPAQKPRKSAGKTAKPHENRLEAIANARAKRREEAAQKRYERRKADERKRMAEREKAEQKRASESAASEEKSAPDILQRVHEAEEARILEKQRIARRDKIQGEATAAYREATKAAKHDVKKLRRASDKQWKKDASAFAANKQLPHAEKLTGGINTAVCLLLAGTIAVGMVVLERPTMSEIENRNLATMPEFSVDAYLSGEYTEGVANYYNDTVPMRSTFKNLTASIRKYMGWHDEGGVTFHGNAPVTPVSTDIPAETTAVTTTVTTVDPTVDVTTTKSTTTTAAENEGQEVGGELSNNILIVDKRAISLYGGSFAVGRTYADSLNKYKRDLGDNVSIYSMVIPTPCSFYTPDEFKYLIGSEWDNIENINSNLENVIPVDAYSALAKHTDEQIYMRTDHHWSAMGAFYAAEEFSAAARVPFARISEYDRVAREGYVGTMYGYSGDITLKNNPEEFFYYVPKAEYTTRYYTPALEGGYEGSLLLDIDKIAKPVSWYLVYIGTDERVTHVNTNVKNGRKLAIFKDSYGNALVPWLTSSFEDIYVIDIRYFKPNAIQYLKDVGATDVLFVMNTFSATGGNCKKIEQIRTQ